MSKRAIELTVRVAEGCCPVVVTAVTDSMGSSALTIGYADLSANIKIFDPTVAELDALIHTLQRFRATIENNAKR